MVDQIHFQFPAARSGFLLETLLGACEDASGGGSIFAWCNKGGIDALLRDPVYEAMLSRGGTFDFVVGVDSITDVQALEDLKEIADSFPSFKPRVLVHAQGGSTFHPKFSWFVRDRQLITIIGSGNMTLGGLRKNWEVSMYNEWEGNEVVSRLAEISAYLTQLDPYTVPVDHPAAMDRARSNSSLRKAARLQIAKDSKASRVTLGKESEEMVLLAQIPASDNRWAQANFDKDTFQNFFGAQPSRQSRIILRAALPGGALGAVESRPSVAVRSQNYRFELAQARGLTYPTKGRPIVGFLRRSPGNFIYQLLMPGDPDYQGVLAFMAARWQGRSDRMIRLPMKRSMVEAALPSLTLWPAAGMDDTDDV